MNNDNSGNGNGRIEALLARQKQIQAALAAEQLKKQKRQKQATEKEQSIIGGAVMKAAAVFPEFKTIIAQTALANIADEKQRRFLAERGWNV